MSAAKSILAAFDRDPTAGLPASAKRGVWWPLRLLGWIAAAILLSGIIIAPLDTWSQTLFATFTFGLCWLLSLAPGRWVTLTLIIVSVTISLRYLHWRVSTTVGNEDGVDMALGFVLFFAESYAVLVLVLGYVQTAWPLERKPIALPADPRTWPTVDIYIPTYNEPLSVVRTTILAAKALDWPADKLFVHLLDDGRREEFRLFCQKAGVNYIVRPDNKHAKAGNINHALKKTRGDLVAIFDCDHIPTRSFLQLTVGWFMRDPKIALVQTPHHFYTPDPFERNLSNFKKIPNEGELFYGPIQKGNDLWNATFFCGSCAVIRRAPLEEVGGIAPETVTEDAHTMLKLHRRGYSSAYIDIPQAAGLATESLSGHVGQRIRWARGMAQIFRVDNPLLGRGLGLVQRLCYASAMLHFFYGIPRLIFLTAPLAFLVFDAHIFNASAETILAFALPHMAHAYLTNSRIQGAHRHSFWAEVYEATLATYIIYPTTLALISPKLGKFNVTAKGGVVDDDYFDRKIAFPYLVLLALNLFGTGMGIYKLTLPDAQTSAIYINLAWSAYGLLFLCATLAVAWERRQRRVFPRVEARLPATLRTPDQKVIACETINLSTSGLSLLMPMEAPVAKDDLVDVTIVIGKDDVPAEARVVQKHGRVLRLSFESMSIESEESLVRATFSRPSAWLDWSEGRRRDRPILALFTVIWHGLSGLARLPRALVSRRGAGLILVGLIGLSLAREPALAQPSGTPDVKSETGPDGWTGGEPLEVDPVGVGVDEAPTPEPAPAPAPVEAPPVAPPGEPDKKVEAPFVPTTTWSLEHLGFDKAVRTYNRRTAIRLPFYARGDEVFLAARLRLDLDQSARVPDGVTAAKISVNDEVIATIKLDGTMPPRLDLVVPPEQLGEKNALSVELVLASGAACPVLVEVGAWRFLVGGRLEAMSAPLPLPNQLDLLPVPFFDPFADSVTPIAFVFGRAPVGTAGAPGSGSATGADGASKPVVGPGERLVKIGGYLAAYFGVRGGARFSFPTTFGALPEGHAVVFYVPGMKTTPEIADLGPVLGPMLALRDNPNGKKKHSKVLVVAGRDLDELEVAAKRLLLDFEATKGQGATVRFDYAPTVEPRQPYDAPRWFPGGAPLPLGVVADKAGRTFRGALGGSVTFEMRIPPDVFTWPSAYVNLDLEWRSVVPPGVEAPELSVEINGHFLARLSLAKDPVEAEHQSKRLRLPVTELRGFNRLNVHVIPPKSACPNPNADVVEVEILETSILHLEGHERYRPMPDLETFVNDGFPFTRMADLAETLLVLPREPEPGEVASALSFIAHTTAITGHPPTRLSVAMTNTPESLDVGDRDLLVIGAAGRLAGWAPWEGKLPIRGLTEPDAAHVQLPSVSWFQRAMAFLQGVPLGDDLERLGRALRPGESRAYAVGFESPWQPGRSVVLLSADRADAMPSLPSMKGFAEALQARADVLVMSGERRAVFRVLSNYAAGGLPPFLTFLWFIASHWVVLMPVLLLTAMAFAWLLKRRLNNVAWRRLSVGQKT